MPDQTRLFVIGNPRSGTSLLRIMLNSHKSIVIPPECGYIHWWYEKYKNWDETSDISAFISDLKTSKKIQTWNLDFEKFSFYLKENIPKDYEELVFSVINFYGLSNNYKTEVHVLGDKNNYYTDYLNLLRKISPTSKFIFIFRDPRDIYCSYKKIEELNTNSKYVPQLPQNVRDFNKSWLKNQRNIQEFIKGLSLGQYLIVNYESIIFETEHTLTRICEFLGIDYDSKMLEFYKTNDEPKELLDWKKKTLKPLDKTSVGTYQKNLTANESKAIEDATFSLYESMSNVI